MLQHFVTRPVLGKLNIFGVLALAGMVGPAVLLIADLTAALSQPGYNLIHDSISSLALTPLGWIQIIGFMAIGLLVEIFVAGILLSIHGRRGFRIGVGILVFFGFGLLLIGAFRVDPVGSPPTVEGTIHYIMSATVFWLFPIAGLFIAPSLKRDPNWQGLFRYTVISSGLAIALLIGHFWISEQSSWFGLYERLLVAEQVIWVEAMAIWLLRLSLRARMVKPEASSPGPG